METKEDVLTRFGAVAVDAIEVYKDIFRIGEGAIQKKNETAGAYKTNPLGLYTDDFKHFSYRIMFEDTFEEDLQELQRHKLALLNGITYFGKKNTASNASKMYAMIFDLDGITPKGLANYLTGALSGYHYPIPNYIILSGHGIHLYYVFEFPINLYPNIKLQLKDFKYKLTEKMWNRYTSTIEKPQIQGIYQPFRVIGGMTKPDADIKKSVAYRLNTHPITIDYLNRFVPDKFEIDDTKLYKENKYTLAEAKKKFPKWYEEVVEGKKVWSGKWHVSENLYNWWIRKIYEGATFGHRYFCILALAIFAIKCDVPEEKAKKDAIDLIPYLKSITNEQDFGMKEINSAFECFDLKYKTFPRKDLEKITAILMPPNKRNGRKQKVHLAGARAIQKINDEFNNTDWREGNGRPEKKEIVRAWREANPNGKKADCIRATGLSKPTVLKWWNE